MLAYARNRRNSGADAATTIDRLTQCRELITERITSSIYAATIMPRTSVTGSMETTRRSVNAWMRTSPLFRDIFEFAHAVSSDDETLVAAIDSDGIHLTTQGYARLADAVTHPIITSA